MFVIDTKNLEKEAALRTVEVNDLLAELRLLSEWNDERDAERAHFLERKKQEVVNRLGVVLEAWANLNGRIALTPPGALLPVTLVTEVASTAPPIEAAAPSATEAAPEGEEEIASEPVPEPTPVAAPKGKPLVVSSPAAVAALSGLQARWRGGLQEGSIREIQVTETPDWQIELGHMLDNTEVAADMTTDMLLIERMMAASRQWPHLPLEVLKTLFEHLVARLRRLHVCEPIKARREVCRDALQQYKRRHSELPFVHGLSAKHKPQHGSWIQDARVHYNALCKYAAGGPVGDSEVEERRTFSYDRLDQAVRRWNEADATERPVRLTEFVREVREALESGMAADDTRLVNLATPFLDALNGPEFRVLRQMIRKAQAGSAPPAAKEEVLPADWPHWSLTRDQHALMVGGNPEGRETLRLKLEQMFGFAGLEWVDPQRAPKAIVQRIRNRRYGLVIINRFNDHSAGPKFVDACRQIGIPMVWMQKGGYGPAQLKTAIEEGSR